MTAQVNAQITPQVGAVLLEVDKQIVGATQATEDVTLRNRTEEKQWT